MHIKLRSLAKGLRIIIRHVHQEVIPMIGKGYKGSSSSSVIVIFLLALISLSFGSIQSATARTAGGGGSSGRSSDQRSISEHRSSGGSRSSGGEHTFRSFSNQRSAPAIHSQPGVMNQRNERTSNNITNQKSVPSINTRSGNRNSVNEQEYNRVTNKRSITGTGSRSDTRNENRGSISSGNIDNRRFNGAGTQRSTTGTNLRSDTRNEERGSISAGDVDLRRHERNNTRTGTRDRIRGFDNRGVFDRDRGFRFHHRDHFPSGSVFWCVPFGAEVFLFGGLTYFWWNDIWYRPIYDRYVVVGSPYDTDVVDQEPTLTPSTVGDGEQMVITEELLDVYSGPGLDYPVVYVLHAGDVVTIHGYDSDWVYVTNSNDENGWIMSQYASPVSSEASG
jgi:hypothetical protein